MTHRVHPKGFRVKELADWLSRGFYGDNPAVFLEEDYKIRKFLEKKLKLADIEKIEIERFSANISVIIHTARPGLIIGRRGENVTALKSSLQKFGSDDKVLRIEIRPVKNPWVSAQLCAQWIANRIEKRMPFRMVLKQALSKIVVNKDVEGARVQISGRLNGVLMSRTEWLKQGKLRRQSLRSDMDYALVEANCSYGVIGVKVWIYKGEKI